jgi:hypothetical protein
MILQRLLMVCCLIALSWAGPECGGKNSGSTEEAALIREGQPDLSLHEKARRPSSPRATPAKRE